jgi:hypothetical protein
VLSKLIGVLAVFGMATILLWAALPATDAFTNTDGVALSTHNANWTYDGGSFAISSNTAIPSTAGFDFARWTGDTFAADQYSQGVAGALLGSNHMGLAVRMNTSGGLNSYFAIWTSGGTTLRKNVAGNVNTLATVATNPSAGDVMRIEVSGTSVVLKKNGVAFLGPVTDSNIATGTPGLAGYGASSPTNLDDWEAGNLGSTTRRRVVAQ